MKPISTNRAEEIGWIHQVFEDDTLMSAEERHAYKKQIINREMKDRNHGLLEFAKAIVGLGEIAFIGGVTKSMVGIAREVKLLQALRAGRPHVFDAFNPLVAGKMWEKNSGSIAI